ncbi:MAG: D-alanyl-D-alanine carboxypeptidase [Ferruginibacter sp.]
MYNNTIFPFGKNRPRFGNYSIPFITSDSLLLVLLSDTLHKIVLDEPEIYPDTFQNIYNDSARSFHSRPVDSLFRPMMFNSDNFFAEQTLLMVSHEKFGSMSDTNIIDSLLANDLKDMPTKPRWVDGSGLSRYNLFSPKDFIYILDKIKKEFGWKRIKNILPTGGQGTLTGYYEKEAGNIYAKTGSMSNNVALSGYLVTEKNRELVFSVIVNNFSGSGRSCRKAIERLLKDIRSIN